MEDERYNEYIYQQLMDCINTINSEGYELKCHSIDKDDEVAVEYSNIILCNGVKLKAIVEQYFEKD